MTKTCFPISFFFLSLSFIACGTNDQQALSWQDAARARQSQAASTLFELSAQPDLQLRFLQAMPKGADLHNHISGSTSTEDLISWGSADGLCVSTTTFTAVAPPCAAGAVLLSSAPPQSDLYKQVLQAWSNQDFMGMLLDRHQHFFDAFGKFGAITGAANRATDQLVAERSTAVAHHVAYLELLQSLDSGKAGALASRYMRPTDTWTDRFLSDKRDLLVEDADFQNILQNARANLATAEAQVQDKLKCATATPDPACGVTVRYLIQANRTNPREYVFAQFVYAMEMQRSEPRVVGLNLVSPEENANSLAFYEDEMLSLGVLRRLYSADASQRPVHISLHAGELIPQVLPATADGQRQLTLHIRRAVEVATAERIGHGVDVLGENEGPNLDATMLLDQMHDLGVMVEICLSSNAQLLGAQGATHPLSAYLAHQVPTALATDDQGILRSNLSAEFVRAVTVQGLRYGDLVAMARRSLEYSFLDGKSLWQQRGNFDAVAACAQNEPGAAPPTADCQQYLMQNPRAQLQWQLESQLIAFETAAGAGSI